MKSFSFILIILTISAVFTSCEKTADIKTPDYTPKLVLHSFISPDDTFLRVHVSTTINIFGEIRNYPESLPVTVKLIDGEKEIIFSPRDSDDFCSLEYKIEPGKEYGLVARCDGYPDASAHCRVPSFKNINLTADTLNEVFTYENGSYRIQKFITKFEDISGMSNYYNIYATQTEISAFGNNIYSLNIIDPQSDYNYTSYKLLSDQLMDGKIIITEFNTYFNISDPGLTSLELNACILETDADYYKYHNSLDKYKGSDEPFTEFSPVYTNVSGGYGIFASFVRYKKTLKLK